MTDGQAEKATRICVWPSPIGGSAIWFLCLIVMQQLINGAPDPYRT
jgi:hypothetical protein